VRKVVAHLIVFNTQELVSASGHVDVKRLALGALAIKELIDGNLGWGQLQ